jgi:hypothetical protein
VFNLVLLSGRGVWLLGTVFVLRQYMLACVHAGMYVHAGLRCQFTEFMKVGPNDVVELN